MENNRIKEFADAHGKRPRPKSGPESKISGISFSPFHILLRGDILNRLKRYTIVGILFSLITGTLFHFAYKWSGNNHIAGFFSAVNESTWEHMKLVFFPMLLYSFYMNRNLKNVYPCVTSALLFGTLLGTLLIPIIFYTYSGVLGQDLPIFNIGTFIISVLISFCSIYQLSLSCRLNAFQDSLEILVLFFAVCFLLFTYHPPTLGIFIDPTK